MGPNGGVLDDSSGLQQPKPPAADGSFACCLPTAGECAPVSPALCLGKVEEGGNGVSRGRLSKDASYNTLHHCVCYGATPREADSLLGMLQQAVAKP